MEMSRPRKPQRIIALAALLIAWSVEARGQASFFDPRFQEIRRASVAWDRSTGPSRGVVDVVCLVPDYPTFLEVISTWDEGHYFPILIDDVELNLKFLRVFRPARVVRYHKKGPALAPGEIWEKSVSALGKAWVREGLPVEKPPSGDRPPVGLGPTPPGIVVSSPGSPALAGAVALAAGRYQPLMRWETEKHFGDGLARDEARSLALTLESKIAEVIPRYEQLGDDCDFVTLAGDYPYRYDENGQVNAFDDLVLRSSQTQKRWGFAGRLMGSPAQSVYRAMCSLFLSPSSALLFNSYSEKDAPWNGYTMGTAAKRLSASLKVVHRNGELAGLGGWHQAFDPINPFGLVIFNSHGGPTDFHLADGQAAPADIPESGPTAVLMIHSFSAWAPVDPETVAGRWLANGAFVLFGSMNEPYLQAFRPPTLVSAFLGENLPVVTAVRKSGAELYGQPWRLVFFGDPLYRLRPVGSPLPRLAAWPLIAGWPEYGEYQTPEAGAPESQRLTWALRAAIFQVQTRTKPRRQVDIAATLLGIGRDRLDAALRPIRDELLVDTLLHEGRTSELIDQLIRVPPGERTPSLKRHLETAIARSIQNATNSRDFRQGLALWNDLIRVPESKDYVRVMTERVGRLADSPARLSDWRDRLRTALKTAGPDAAGVIEGELKRVDQIRGK